jgi:hypothetical protein
MGSLVFTRLEIYGLSDRSQLKGEMLQLGILCLLHLCWMYT